MSIPRLAHSPTSAWNAFYVYFCFNNTALLLSKQEELTYFNTLLLFKRCPILHVHHLKKVRCGIFRIM